MIRMNSNVVLLETRIICSDDLIILKDNGIDPNLIPLVIQFNKRDMPDVRSDEEIDMLAKKGKELKEDMDALVDEIDEVLEENAEEFVKNYVQRGGE